MRKPFKIAGAIVGLLFLAGLIGSMVTSLADDSAPAAVSPSAPVARPKLDRVAVLNRQAQKVSKQGEAAMARAQRSGKLCSVIPVADAKTARLVAIGVQLRGLGAPNPKLEASVEKLDGYLTALRAACA